MGVQGSRGMAELTRDQTVACGLEKTWSSFPSQDREDELAGDPSSSYVAYDKACVDSNVRTYLSI